MSILELWQQNREIVEGKSIEQVLLFCGNGKLSNHNTTSNEFRDLLDNLPSSLLKRYTEECLTNSFKDSGLVLQDIINQIGTRIGFSVEYGLYKGKAGEIGYDGIWTSIDGHQIIVEVKTTDTYRINLNTLAGYRNKLVEQNRIDSKKSSILIVVGRQDTGDLEAQIRGSRHAWDIRLISVDSIIQLMSLKENLNDVKTSNQINELLKPLEYTRVDNLVNIVFSTTTDIQSVDEEEEFIEQDLHDSGERDVDTKTSPAHFHESCIKNISKYLSSNMIRQAKTLYESSDNIYRVACIVSKKYEKKSSLSYWFAFHPSQKEFLEEKEKSFIAFGCGSEKKIVFIPYDVFRECMEGLRRTEKKDRYYWHIDIFEREDDLYLYISLAGKQIKITQYLLPIG